MKTRALIVDDEALARSRLRKMLDRESDVSVVGECSNGPEAISAIREQRPEVIFLDVQMPEVNGFDVLRALPGDTQPAVIFVTAHDRHAVEAFEVNALDYLLKPFTQARLHQALQRAHERTRAQSTPSPEQLLALLESVKPSPGYLDRVAVKTGTQTLFIKVEEIEFVESAANYVVLRARGAGHVLRETLSNLETRLPPRMFLRISRSIIVNLDRVRALQLNPQGDSVVVLEDGRQLVVTRTTREIQHRLQFGRPE
jgi:two-component system LytT family response regulator